MFGENLINDKAIENLIKEKNKGNPKAKELFDIIMKLPG